MSKLAVSILSTLLLLVMPLAQAQDYTVARWQWLKNTYWYVPKNNLPTLVYSELLNKVKWINDQTVFYISDYKNGYFWGKAVVQLSKAEAKCMAMHGSVTPEGHVLLAFTELNASSTGEVTRGTGVMLEKAGAWVMENQMISGSSSAQVSHWANMVQTDTSKPSWEALPGVNMSVPIFLGQCPAGPTL